MATPLHNTGGSPSPPAGYMRQRSRRACFPCRQRKRKCDGRLPCLTCTGYGYECRYSDDGERKIPKRTALDDVLMPEPVHKAPRLPQPSTHSKVKSAHHGILDPNKWRYMSSDSAIAFPRVVGLDLQSANPPRLHSFAYNTGLRSEPGCTVKFQLVDLIAWNQVRELIDIYASTIHPIFGFLDVERLYRRCEDHWNGKSQGPGLEALISGIIGLASLFSGLLATDVEMRIVLHAKELLEDPSHSRFPSIEQVGAWILRTIYIRATSRPHVSWLSSCTTMHLVEATGLHREMDQVVLMSDSRQGYLQEQSDVRERTAMIAHCLNAIISYDYGRSAVYIGPLSFNKIVPRDGDFSLHLYGLVRGLPRDDIHADPTARKSELIAALNYLLDAPTGHDFVTITRAELCFCVYRRLRLLDNGLKQEQIEQVIAAGTAALPAARRLMASNHPWWNVMSTIFQFVCVLLAIDTTESIASVPDVMETLEIITTRLDTHLAKEAAHTARILVCASLEKKRKGIAILERIAGTPDVGDDASNAEKRWMFDETDWDSFLQPPPATQFLDIDFHLQM
ncbi:transcriptional regulator family: Fungal Specific TF [Paecilomyces variotii]|nr:transcriptional regulator family: Fungal Specific TF [Paecilomyces variotii]